MEDETLPKEPNDDFRLFYIYHKKPESSIMVPEKVNGEKSSMELYIGASISIIPKEAWRRRKEYMRSRKKFANVCYTNYTQGTQVLSV